MTVVPARDALAMLRDGNARFASHERGSDPFLSHTPRPDLAVRPSVEGLLATDLALDRDGLIKKAVRANIQASVNHLRHGSPVLEQLIRDDGLLVVGAEYSLETGRVEFFDRE